MARALWPRSNCTQRIGCRYPGCQCDIPAHNYAYSFAANPQWPNYYATSEQIHAYMKDVAKQYEVEKYIRLQHSVERAVWNEKKGKWDLKIRSGSTLFNDECDVFINASGVLKYVSLFLVFIIGY